MVKLLRKSNKFCQNIEIIVFFQENTKELKTFFIKKKLQKILRNF